MATGTVDFFNDTGGYGFIETEDSDEDVFFHMEDVGGEDLTEGTEIEFDIEQAPTPAPPSDAAWEDSVRQVRDDLQAMKDLVADPDIDLHAEIPHGDGQTYLREAMLVADHNAYHVGQLVTVRRLLDCWPPE